MKSRKEVEWAESTSVSSYIPLAVIPQVTGRS